MEVIQLLRQNSSKLFVFSIICGVISGVLSVVLVGVINDTISSIDNLNSSRLILFLSITIVVIVSRIVFQIFVIHLSNNAIYETRLKLARLVLYTPLRKLEELGGHRVLSTLTDDISAISTALPTVPTLFVNLIAILSCIAYLAWLSVYAIIVILMFIILGWLGYRFMEVKALSILKEGRIEQETLFARLAELTGGIIELKLNSERRSNFINNDLHLSADNYRKHNVVGMLHYLVAHGWGQLVYFCLFGLVLFFLYDYLDMSVEILTGYVITLLYLIGRIEIVMAVLPPIGKSSVALARIHELGFFLQVDAAEVDNILPGDNMLFGDFEYLEMKGMIYKYNGGYKNSSFQVGPINTKFYKGQIIFIVGGNGSGKSTLAKVIAGLYSPASGDLLINNHQVGEEHLHAYREYFSTVFVNYYLFERLLPGKESNFDELIEMYLEKLGLTDKVEIIDGKLSTLDLSQGQRKRLALLSAYLEDRPVYIFDEWAADQDPEFRELFYRQILPDLRKKGKLIIAITHDDRFFDVADQIVRLEYGQQSIGIDKYTNLNT